MQLKFGSQRYHGRRATGRKTASPAAVLRGEARLVAAVATRQHAHSGTDLGNADRERWKRLRQRLDQRRQTRALRTRFRRTAPIGGVAGKDQLIQRAAAFTPDDLLGAYRVRREHCEKWAKIFADNDIAVMLWPEKLQTPPDRADDFTGGFAGSDSSRTNTTGWPTVNVPVGRDADTGIPVGMNILAPLGGDALAIQIGIDYQARYPYHLDLPTEL